MLEANDSGFEGSGLGGFAPCQLTRTSGAHCKLTKWGLWQSGQSPS